MRGNIIKCILLYIRYIIGRCKIEKKYKTLRNPYFVIPLCHSHESGNLLLSVPSFCHSCTSMSSGHILCVIPTPICHSHTPSVIPTLLMSFLHSLCHSRAGGNPSFSVISSTALGARQSHLTLYSNISPYFRYKNYKKTIIITW